MIRLYCYDPSNGNGGWLDAYWLNEGNGAVIKLLEQPAASVAPLSGGDGEPVRVEGIQGDYGRWREARHPGMAAAPIDAAKRARSRSTCSTHISHGEPRSCQLSAYACMAASTSVDSAPASSW